MGFLQNSQCISPEFPKAGYSVDGTADLHISRTNALEKRLCTRLKKQQMSEITDVVARIVLEKPKSHVEWQGQIEVARDLAHVTGACSRNKPDKDKI